MISSPPIADDVVNELVAVERALWSNNRLEQTYTRLDERRYDYVSDYDGSSAVLEYDDDGLIVDYPAIAVRA